MAHGGSGAEALKSAEDAIDLWFDTARGFGDTIPAPQSHELMYA